MRERAGRKAKAPEANAAKQRHSSASQDRDLKTVLSHTPFLLTRCSSDLRYLLVSESYARMIGRDVDDVVGRPIAEMMTENGFQTILPYVRKVLQGHRVEYEAHVNFEGVGPRFLRVIYVPERDSRGGVQGWIASIVDLTDQKLAESRIAADLRAMTILREVGTACAREGLEKKSVFAAHPRGGNRDRRR